MAGDVQTITLGAVTVAVINVYDIPTRLGDMIDVPESERTPRESVLFEQTENLSVQCIYVQGPGLSVLVDAGAYDATYDSSDRSDDQPPPDLITRLAELGVRPSDVAHVVITHCHGDHYNATTSAHGSQVLPTFPNARYYVGQADWDEPRLQDALGKPDSLESRTLGVLRREGCLVTVEGDRDLGGGVQIVAAPGETRGHQIVRIRSYDHVLYCLGDLFHHPVEVEHPTWMVRWADRDANLASRRSLAEAALAENALLVATHIRGIGRLQRTSSGVVWVGE